MKMTTIFPQRVVKKQGYIYPAKKIIMDELHNQPLVKVLPDLADIQKHQKPTTPIQPSQPATPPTVEATANPSSSLFSTFDNYEAPPPTTSPIPTEIQYKQNESTAHNQQVDEVIPLDMQNAPPSSSFNPQNQRTGEPNLTPAILSNYAPQAYVPQEGSIPPYIPPSFPPSSSPYPSPSYPPPQSSPYPHYPPSAPSQSINAPGGYVAQGYAPQQPYPTQPYLPQQPYPPTQSYVPQQPYPTQPYVPQPYPTHPTNPYPPQPQPTQYGHQQPYPTQPYVPQGYIPPATTSFTDRTPSIPPTATLPLTSVPVAQQSFGTAPYQGEEQNFPDKMIISL